MARLNLVSTTLYTRKENGMNDIMTPNEARELLGLKPINNNHEQSIMTQNNFTNCPNCGAPITSWKCDYCDTVFDREFIYKQKESINFEIEQLQSAKLIESLYEDAIKAIRRCRNPYL